jgi:predicted dehydrogenase
MPEFARRCYPATLRLKELLATTLGQPRLIVGHSRLFGFDRYALPGPTTQIAPAPLTVDPGSYLLDWCVFVFQALPTSVQGYRCVVLPSEGGEKAEPDHEGFVVGFPGGGTAQIAYGRYHRTRWGDASRFLPPPGFQVFAERGVAWLEMPEKIQWSDASGTHEERLPLEPTVGDVLNDQFHRLVRGDQSLAPTIHDALEIARLVQDLRRSQCEGRVMTRTPE